MSLTPYWLLHGMQWDCLTSRKWLHYHSLTGHHGMIHDETAWQKITVHYYRPTVCSSWHGIRCSHLGENHCIVTHMLLIMEHGHDSWGHMALHSYCTITHCLLVMGWDTVKKMRLSLPGKKMTALPLTPCWLWDAMYWLLSTKWLHCHSQPVGHVIETWWNHDCQAQYHWTATHSLLLMRWDVPVRDPCSITHSLLIMECDQIVLWKITVLSLTPYWSWDVMWCDCLAENGLPLTTCWSWDYVLRLPGRKQLHHCYSPAIGHSMRYDPDQKITALSLTPCLSWGLDVIRSAGKQSHLCIVTHSLPVVG